jgi:hypothetical protein
MILNGENDSGRWYLYGPYAVTIGHALNFPQQTPDPHQIKLRTESLMENIIKLSARSSDRIYGKIGLSKKRQIYFPFESPCLRLIEGLLA